MKILSLHNSYQQPGGEDEVFRQETCLLERHGDEVIRHQVHNDELRGKGSLELLRKTIYNSEAYYTVCSLIRHHRPHVMHVHNTFPLLSPAVYHAAADEGVAVVQTLHNYRLLCPSAVLFRDHKVCESCVGSLVPWRGVMHGCYRNSRSASAAAASMLSIHRLLRTQSRVGTYVALSDFVAAKFVEAGIPKHKVVVKPNFIDPDPGPGTASEGYCLFVGRLTEEKGVRSLLDAWTRFAPPMDLEIAGDGDLAQDVVAAAERNRRISWHGRLPKPKLYERMKRAAALIVPSIWYEPFGMVVVEAFAMGVPVIASRIGALADMVTHGRNGLHFVPGDASDLAAQVRWVQEHPAAVSGMQREARRDFETLYTGERNYSLLMKIYRDTIVRSRVGDLPAVEPLRDPAPSPARLVQILSHPSSRSQTSPQSQ